jgi:transmembrane sensor
MNERTRDMIEAEAIDQFVQLNEPADRARHAAEFSEWLTRSPAHVEAFLALVLTWGALNLPAEGALRSDALIAAARAEPEARNVVTLPRRIEPVRDPRRNRVMHAWQAAAAMAVVLCGWLIYAHVMAAHVYANAGTEVRRVTLPDGSLVSLSPSSEVYLHWTASERRLDLRRGRVRFQVAKNPQRPFLVDTAFGTVRAVGTVFDVDARRQEMRVTVIEGRVAVESRAQRKTARDGVGPSNGLARGGAADAANSSLQLSAGDRATISSGEVTGTGDVAPSIMAWAAQRVVFRGATLGAVVDELNRYQGRPVVIDDSELATLVISGVFDPKNPDSLLSYLQLYEGVRVDRMGDGSVLLSRTGQPRN